MASPTRRFLRLSQALQNCSWREPHNPRRLLPTPNMPHRLGGVLGRKLGSGLICLWALWQEYPSDRTARRSAT